MYFNGFTLMLVILSLVGGFAAGVRYENQYQKSRRLSVELGETIEQQMARDGWRV
jgi:hypothetical protein